MKTHLAFVCLALLTSSALAQQDHGGQTVAIVANSKTAR
jgi:hypothetical protein